MTAPAAYHHSELDLEREKRRAQLATAINEEDDPLAVYDQFVQWTVMNYGESAPHSGLLELLEEATRQFQDDPVYKTDLRYLKLWTLYAAQVDRPRAIHVYAHLLAKEIGTSFSILYESYASLLEADGRHKDAGVIYQQGIRRQARPLERLKTRYQYFKSRATSSSTQLIPSNPPAGSSTANAPLHETGQNPLQGHSLQDRSASTSSSSAVRRAPASRLPTFNSTPESRYAAMLVPANPGKRPEQMRFNMSLLFTKEGGEFSIQEARARSMGLLGKKWGPPPASSSLLMPVEFNDDGMKPSMGGRRKSLFGGGEPTVTINTKEALEDVFGMYNSPDRTIRTAPGSKYAPLREVKPITPNFLPRPTVLQGNENAVQNAKAPTSFRPFVDENANLGRSSSVKFTPYVDENENAPSGRTPSVKFTPFVENKASFTTSRHALSVKESTAPAHVDENSPPNTQGVPKLKTENTNLENVFSSKVFTPAQTKPPPLAPLRDVFTDDHGKPQPKVRPVHERAKSHHDILSPGPNDPARAFSPLLDEDAKTPFKVFSRPPEQAENAFTPFRDLKPAFTPYKDVPAAITPFVDAQPEPAPPPLAERSIEGGSKVVVEIDDSVDEDRDAEQYQEDSQYDDDDEEHEQYEAPLAIDQLSEYEEGDSYQEIPLGGRFGRFNVMTPITERTFEFTSSTRGAETPSNRLRHISEARTLGYENVFVPQQRDEHGAAIAAERLAAELKKGDGEAYDEGQPLEPLRLSVHLPPQTSPPVAVIEEKTGTLSLGDTLTLNSRFKPPNPCNPFDPSIMGALLSRIPTDPHFYDMRDRESNKLDGLQKFAKKGRKISGAESFDVSSCFSVELDGHRFSVSEKLGEGGFGAVFKARDLGTRGDGEDSDEADDDDEEDGVSMVALKVVKPRNLWEYHVLRRLHSVLPASLRHSVILPHALYAFRDESFLILDLCPQGTLLSIVNNAGAAGVSQQGACLDELLVVFFTVELLRLLEVLHKAGFIHGDLKIDNCLLRLEDVPGGGSAWSSIYQPSGEGGWSYKGLKVIDFGRTIDTRLYPNGQQFIAEWPTDDRDCFEAREDRPWTFQTDYFGLVSIIYCMLFGKYIQSSSVVMVSDRYKISAPLKRYWQTDLWNRLFDVLLNPCHVRSDGQLPVSEELGALRGEMEAWLQANCNRTSNTLKGLLKKVEVSCYVH